MAEKRFTFASLVKAFHPLFFSLVEFGPCSIGDVDPNIRPAIGAPDFEAAGDSCRDEYPIRKVAGFDLFLRHVLESVATPYSLVWVFRPRLGIKPVTRAFELLKSAIAEHRFPVPPEPLRIRFTAAFRVRSPA